MRNSVRMCGFQAESVQIALPKALIVSSRDDFPKQLEESRTKLRLQLLIISQAVVIFEGLNLGRLLRRIVYLGILIHSPK